MQSNNFPNLVVAQVDKPRETFPLQSSQEQSSAINKGEVSVCCPAEGMCGSGGAPRRHSREGLGSGSSAPSLNQKLWGTPFDVCEPNESAP